MNTTDRTHGNTLVLVLISIGVLVVIVGFIVLNFSQLVGVHKEAATAIDASALSAAKNMSRIVVNTPLGRIGLMDDVPALTVPSGQSGGRTDPRPIQSINTLMGTLRLDAIIASKLTSPSSPNGNTAILYMIKDEQAKAMLAANLLKTTIISAVAGGAAYDKYGIKVDIPGDVKATFLANNPPITYEKDQPLKFVITPGYLDPTVPSNIACPKPASADPITNGQAYYDCYKDYKGGNSGPASNLVFQFVPLAKNVALIAGDKFKDAPPTGANANLPPTAVKVYVDVKVKAATTYGKPDPKKPDTQRPTSTLNAVSYAQCDGGEDFVFPSGTLVVSFASGGIPGLNPGATQPAVGGKLGSLAKKIVDFSSPVTIMNTTPADPNNGTAAIDPWSRAGKWYRANGGPVPGSGSLSTPMDFKLLAGHFKSNPSTALSFLVYDWLKTLALRPNVDAMVNALSLKSTANAQIPGDGFYGLETRIVNNSMQVPATLSFNIASNFAGPSLPFTLPQDRDNWFSPAYADTDTVGPGTIDAMMNFSKGDPDNDPRDLGMYDKNPQAYQRQQSEIWGYVPALPVLPDTSRLVKMTDGDIQTVDGHPLVHMYDLWHAMRIGALAADKTQANAWELLLGKLVELEDADPALKGVLAKRTALEAELKSAQEKGNTAAVEQASADLRSINKSIEQTSQVNLQKAFKEMPRAYAALVNARYFLGIVDSIGQNQKALTGMGVEELADRRYILAGAEFLPPGRAASIKDLKAEEGVVPTGQDPSAPLKDWCAMPDSSGKSKLYFYKRTGNPAIGSKVRDSGGLPWAIAAATSAQNPYDKLKFGFYVVGTKPGEGKVNLSIGESPFAGVSTLKGQYLYQNVQAIETNIVGAEFPDEDQYSGAAYNLAVAAWLEANKAALVARKPVINSTVWQVQARDQTAMNYSSSTANTSIADSNAAGYFADMQADKGPKQAIDTPWCEAAGQTTSASQGWSTPKCPALAAEWQLTCPIPSAGTGDTPVTYHPGTPGYTYVTSGGMSGMYYVGNHCAVNLYGNTWGVSAAQSYFAVGGLLFYQGTVAGANWAGNGWSVTTTPVGGTVRFLYTTTSVLEFHS